MMVWLNVDDADAVVAWALARGAVRHPRAEIQDTFSGDRVGQFTDPFGSIWRVATPREQITQETADRRLA